MGNRVPYPGKQIPPFRQQSNTNYPPPSKGGSPLSQNGNGFQDNSMRKLFPGTLGAGDYDYNYYPETSEKTDSCFISQVYQQSIPAGDVKNLPNLELLKVVGTRRDECGAACCALGPSKCQYLWIVKGKCLAVACSERDKEKCMPSKLSDSSSSLQSTYYKMSYGNNAGIMKLIMSDKN